MKFVLNKCFGGPSLSQWAANQLNIGRSYFVPESFDVIELVEKFGSEKCSGACAKLKVVEIPDNMTDYEINEYDGFESITYVVDGKIYHA